MTVRTLQIRKTLDQEDANQRQRQADEKRDQEKMFLKDSSTSNPKVKRQPGI